MLIPHICGRNIYLGFFIKENRNPSFIPALHSSTNGAYNDLHVHHPCLAPFAKDFAAKSLPLFFLLPFNIFEHDSGPQLHHFGKYE